MRHRMQKNTSFGRHRGPRKALLRNLIQAMVEQERIKTTLTKARYVRPLVERAITMGKKGDLNSRRILASRYPNKKTVHKIMNDLSLRFKDRPGGYTRIIKLGFRSGDQAPLAYIEFIDYKPKAITVKKTDKITKTDNKSAGMADDTNKKKAPMDKKSKQVLFKKRKAVSRIQKKSRRINRK